MAQLGNTYTGKVKDIPTTYLGPNHFYWAFDSKELFSFENDHSPYLVFDQDNDLRNIKISISDLPELYTQEDILTHLNTLGVEKKDIETLIVEIDGGSDVGDIFKLDWGFIANKPVTFPPSQHTHSYNDLTNLPDLSNLEDASRTEADIKNIIKNFLVEGDGIELVYDSTNDVLRFVVTGGDGTQDNENINIVVNISSEALNTVDETGLAYYLNNLNPPIMIEATHNLYFNIADEISSSSFDNFLDLNLF